MYHPAMKLKIITITALIALLLGGCALKPGMVKVDGRLYCTTAESCTSSIREKIQSNWILPANSMGQYNKVVLDIVIGSDNSINDISIVSSSGSEQFDESVIKAVKWSSPFNTLNGVESSELRELFEKVRFVFSHISRHSIPYPVPRPITP
jgi:TonB family protein